MSATGKRNYMTDPDVLHIGQVWVRRRDKTEASVKQVWRARRQAMIELEGRRQTISFADLARFWKIKED